MLKNSRAYRQMCHAGGFHLLQNETSGQHSRMTLGTGFVTAALTPSDHLNMIHVRSAVHRLQR